MDDQGGRVSPPYLRSYQGYGDSHFRSSVRSEANSSISSYRDFPNARKYQAEGLATPKGTIPQANSRAVISALKVLQEKIKKLELERTDAEDNLKRLAKESKHYKDILQQEHYAKSATQGLITRQNEDLQDNLQSAEARCTLLEKQLDYMRKMVQTAEMDRDNAVQRSAMLSQQISHQATEDFKGQLGKLTGLEREHMKLTASHSLAENKIRDLEEKLRSEAHHRKLLQDKTAQLQTESERNRILLETATSPPRPKKKKKKIKGKPKITKSAAPNPAEHFHLDLGNIPFVVGKSATRSHSVGANIQQALSLLKGHNPSLCNAIGQRQARARRSSASTSASDSGSLEDLLLGLQDEFGHMSFEHQELARQINDTEDSLLREDLERELEHLVKRMEAKGEQIAMVKHQLSKRTDVNKPLKTRPRPATTRQRSASAVLPANGGEVQVVTTVKTKGKGVSAEVENRIKRPGGQADKNLKVLKGMQNLQSSLTKDDLHWD